MTLLVAIEGLVRIFEYSDISQCYFIGRDAFNKIDDSLQKQICLDNNALWYEKSHILRISPDQHFQTININSYGFRGHEITKEKPENTFRIIMVGGSTMFGAASTSDGTTIPGYLQKKYDRNPAPIRL